MLLSTEGAGTGRGKTEVSTGKTGLAGAGAQWAREWYLLLAVLWALLLLGSSWLGWGMGRGCLKKKIQVLGSISNTSAGSGGFISPSMSESVHFSPCPTHRHTPSGPA